MPCKVPLYSIVDTGNRVTCILEGKIYVLTEDLGWRKRLFPSLHYNELIDY